MLDVDVGEVAKQSFLFSALCFADAGGSRGGGLVKAWGDVQPL
jgi:hypothetical protein